MKKCGAVRADFKNKEAELKKVMLLAAVVAMVMAAAVPALAQTVTQAGDGSIACVQTAVQQNVVGNNSPQGNGNALATGEGDNIIADNISNESAQAVAQECNITVSQVDTVVSKYLDVNNGKVVKYQYSSATASAYAKAPAAVQYKYSAPAAVQYEYSAPAAAQYQYASASAAPAALPDTGGASLIALGAGVLLVAGGLLARKIVR
jgi:hypothetical protein